MDMRSESRPSVLPGVDADDLIHAAARLTRDLNTPRAVIYWIDLLASAAIGYAGLGWAVTAGPIAIKLVAGLVSVLALYRAISFIHELTHLKPGALPGFHTAWNLLVGVPLLLPSFMYEGIHALHHTRTRYGTDQDPEYLPLARMSPWRVVIFLLASLLAPFALIVRYAVLTPLSLFSPTLRRVVVERFSALAIAPSFRRQPPEGCDWLAWETATSLLAIALVAMCASGIIRLKAWLTFAAIASGVAFCNQLRTLVAHLWENDGRPISVTAQYLDSVNVPDGFLAALWAPVGLRYHALHHLLPGLPYHALCEAHRRLRSALPPDSPFHRADHKSLTGLTWRLLRTRL